VSVPSFAESGASVAWILGADALPHHVDPDKAALRWGDHVRTYAELRARSLSLARALRKAGLKPGDRVAAHFLNRGETFELYFACAYAGLTLVPVNFRLVAREIDLILSDCSPGIVFTQADLAPQALEAAGDRRVVCVPDDESGDEYEAMASGPPLEPPFERTDLQVILYTSGTTGRPKGAMLSHLNVMWFALQQAALYAFMDSDMVMMLMGPTYNTAGINEQSIPTFVVGGTVTVHPSRGWTPQVSSRLIDQWGVTHTLIYPSMMEPFLEADREQRIGLESLRFALSGGENCPPATVARWRRRWPHVVLMIAYGMTEGGVVTGLMGDEIDRQEGSVGRAFGGQTLKVADEHGNSLPVGQTGVVWTAAPSVISGYWNAPVLTEDKIRDGWLLTGDAGHLDEDGYLYIDGRTRDLIISKGQNIYPAEVENVLSEHADILENSVVGVPDPEWGEAVCAVVVVKPGRSLSEDDVVDFVRERLASYKKPRSVVFVDRLPRSPAEKVLKNDLVELVVRQRA
jgi:acyl-CoA synthetase (AMP-forming)/AMP-acid ligase II